MTTQLDLLDAIDEKKKAGYVCQCCGQFVKMYSRPFLSSMALVLIAIYKSGKTDFFHVERFLKNLNRGDLRGDFHKARFWGLLEKKIELRADNSPRNGFYKITGRGILFVEGKLSIPERILIFDNKFMGYEGKEVTILDVLGKKFDYSELMKK